MKAQGTLNPPLDYLFFSGNEVRRWRGLEEHEQQLKITNLEEEERGWGGRKENVKGTTSQTHEKNKQILQN